METLTLALTVFSFVALLVVLWRNGFNVQEAISQTQLAKEYAEDVVLAVEQLWKTGKIAKDERYDWAVARLKEKFPNLDENELVVAIESSVLWAKVLTKEN